MDEKRYFEYDQVSIDATKMEERDDDIHGPITIFKDVVISREIIHAYTDGTAYKPAEELKDAAWTAEGMWAIAGGHPRDAVIMDRDEIHGRTVNARFSKSLIDPKTKRPNNKGIVADLEIFNNKVAPEILEDMKNGKRRDVSIGFFFHRDETPGVISEDGHPLKGGVYDYVQRKMTINHTAFALEAGRCPMPFCGVGADEFKEKVALACGVGNGIFDRTTEDYRDGYSEGLRQYDALRHLLSMRTCYTSIQEKHVLPLELQRDAKNVASQLSDHLAQDDANETNLHNSWNNIFSVLMEGVQTHDCRICKQILRVCKDDVSFLGDFSSSKDLHKWVNKTVARVYNQMDIGELPFHTEGMQREHVLLLQSALNHPFSTYEYNGEDESILTLRTVALDPFGGFPSFEACIKSIMKENPSYTRKQAAGTCAEIEKRSKAKKDDGETIVDESMSDQEDLSGLLAFFRLTRESWDGLLDETRIILSSRWTELKKYYKDGELEKMAGGELTPVDSVLQQDEADCPDCDEDEKKINQIATDLSLEEIDAKLKELKGKRDALRERVRVLEDDLFTDPAAEKKRKRDLRDQINQLWDEMSDLSDEIRAFTEAKAIKITRSALADEGEGTKEEVKTVPFKATKSIEELLNRQ